MAAATRLFVYGTLAPGEVNEHVLQSLQGDWQPASVTGSLHPQGWGATYGFPALRLDPGGEPVNGQLFTSADLPGFWSELDHFEGEAYRRVVTVLRLQDGAELQAHVYVLRE